MARKKEAKLRIFGVTQELSAERYTGWTDQELDYIRNKDIKGICDTIGSKLWNAGIQSVELYGVVHDADVRKVWDDTECTYVVEPKLDHVHVYGRCDPEHCGTITQIAAAVGVEPQYVEKAGRGSYAWDNMLAYLVHAKDPGKYQYDPKKVYNGGTASKSYIEIYNTRKADWEAGRAKKKVAQAKIDVDMLEEQILTGEITRNQVLLTDELYAIYARNKRRCDDAFATYADRKTALTVRAMEAGEFKISVLYVTGSSHAGKSMFTDRLVKMIQQGAKRDFGSDWDVCRCAASNPLDEYMGQEILVMDDLRGAALSASDWLKLLDPDRINMGSARYRNRQIACRVIVINSEKDPLTFFYYLKNMGGDRSEAMDQFVRRIMACVTVYRVPDSDERRISVSHTAETDEYQRSIQGANSANPAYLTLHHDFISDPSTADLPYDAALDYLTQIVLLRNTPDGRNAGELQLTPEELKSRNDALRQKYEKWLDIWSKDHETLRGTNNCPTYVYWLAGYKEGREGYDVE